jgi:3-phosphoshikimate 1-carboxyvinyltransferase
MAMAFAPLAIAGRRISIEDPAVVSKSYTTFWEDMRKAGFKISSS